MSPAAASIGGMKQITTAELAELGEDITLIDVREPDEYAAGHVPWAVSVPLGELAGSAGQLAEAPGPVYLICQSGGRSARATGYLEQRGIEAVNVDGGTGAWIAEGRPTA